MAPKIKVISSIYLVLVNNEVFNKLDSLKEARQFVKSLVINDDLNTVEIVKHTLTETTVDKYETKVTKVLTASQLDDGLE